MTRSMLTSQDLLALDATSLQEWLSAGHLTSVQLVTACLDQIDRHVQRGARLQAIISTAPRELLLQRARNLDSERISGQIRSRLHGIPILVKVRMQYEHQALI